MNITENDRKEYKLLMSQDFKHQHTLALSFLKELDQAMEPIEDTPYADEKMSKQVNRFIRLIDIFFDVLRLLKRLDRISPIVTHQLAEELLSEIKKKAGIYEFQLIPGHSVHAGLFQFYLVAIVEKEKPVQDLVLDYYESLDPFIKRTEPASPLIALDILENAMATAILRSQRERIDPNPLR